MTDKEFVFHCTRLEPAVGHGLRHSLAYIAPTLAEALAKFNEHYRNQSYPYSLRLRIDDIEFRGEV